MGELVEKSSKKKKHQRLLPLQEQAAVAWATVKAGW
jgi:hypothetical protein